MMDTVLGPMPPHMISGASRATAKYFDGNRYNTAWRGIFEAGGGCAVLPSVFVCLLQWTAVCHAHAKVPHCSRDTPQASMA
jgi:hypothetical protein